MVDICLVILSMISAYLLYMAMACDCQCGISSVGILSGIVYDCLTFTVWYVIVSMFLFIT